jgi:hypothetical protein
VGITWHPLSWVPPLCRFWRRPATSCRLSEHGSPKDRRGETHLQSRCKIETKGTEGRLTGGGNLEPPISLQVTESSSPKIDNDLRLASAIQSRARTLAGAIEAVKTVAGLNLT